MALHARHARRFTYGDYVTWPDEERWELLDGVAYDMTPAPSRLHQEVVGALHLQLGPLLRGTKCRVYVAPFDVRLPDGDEDDAQVATVVQPDIVVVCDAAKLDERGCRGAPDFVVEVLSPSTAAKDQREKVALYERHGVRECWVVDPFHRIVTVRVLGPDGTFGPPVVSSCEGTLALASLPGVAVDLATLFEVASGPAPALATRPLQRPRRRGRPARPA